MLQPGDYFIHSLARHCLVLSCSHRVSSRCCRQGDNVSWCCSHDATKYFMSMPANKLELWFALEAERFQVHSASTCNTCTSASLCNACKSVCAWLVVVRPPHIPFMRTGHTGITMWTPRLQYSGNCTARSEWWQRSGERG